VQGVRHHLPQALELAKESEDAEGAHKAHGLGKVGVGAPPLLARRLRLQVVLHITYF
jgi:hypothetical protein